MLFVDRQVAAVLGDGLDRLAPAPAAADRVDSLRARPLIEGVKDDREAMTGGVDDALVGRLLAVVEDRPEGEQRPPRR